jgi:methionyl-tRNA formyltransferase
VPSLEALLASPIDVEAVVTNPDRPAGRGMRVTPSPVKSRALEAGLPVIQPASARDPELLASLRDMGPDVATVVAYGKILPPQLLAVPRLGFVNVHFSLLPLYRGAAPVQRAILDGRTETGVTIMALTEGMDEGPMLGAEIVPILPEDTSGTLGERLACVGAPLLVRTLDELEDGALEPRPQDASEATYAPKVSADEARLDWSKPSEEIARRVRALNPEPGAWTTLGDRRLKVHRVAPVPGRLAPGEIVSDGALVAGTGDGSLALEEVQPAGGRRMTGAELARGLHTDAAALV